MYKLLQFIRWYAWTIKRLDEMASLLFIIYFIILHSFLSVTNYLLQFRAIRASTRLDSCFYFFVCMCVVSMC